MEKLLIEIDGMTQAAVKLAIVCGVLNVKALDEMMAPLIAGFFRTHHPASIMFVAQRVSHKVAEADAEVQRVLEQIADENAGDLWREGTMVDVDVEDTEHHACNPWAEVEEGLEFDLLYEQGDEDEDECYWD